MTKAEQIIEKLNGEQKIIYGGIYYKADMQAIEVIPPKPILIGDIAYKIARKYHEEEARESCFSQFDFQYSEVPKLFELWIPFEGKSLQAIAEDLPKEDQCPEDDGSPAGCSFCKGKPEATALIEFLHSIFITE